MLSDAVVVALTIAIPATIASIGSAYATIRAANSAAEKVVKQTEAAAAKLAEETRTAEHKISASVKRNTELAEATRAELQVVHEDTNGHLSKVYDALQTALETIERLEKRVGKTPTPEDKP